MDTTKIAVGVFNKRANEYQDKYMDTGLYHDTFDVFCNSITKENPDVLEIACGPGNITKYLLQRRPDFKILGTDLAPNMLELAKANNPTAAFQLMDGKDIDRIGKNFDAVMCGFFLPYLSATETVKFIRDAAGILIPNGVFYISTMEDDYSSSGFRRSGGGDEIYMYYHPADSLVAALEENGFVVKDLQRKIYPAQDGTSVTDLVIIAIRK